MKETTEDYFILNRSIGTWLLVATVIATMVNALAVSGVPALVYRGGVLFGQMFVVVLVAPALIYLFGPTIWQLGERHKLVTQGELFGQHYDSPALKKLTGIIGILSTFPFMAIQLSAIGKILTNATAGMISYEAGTLLAGICIGIYIHYGGAKAVVWTDLIQGTLFALIIAGSAGLFLYWAGGITNTIALLQHKIPEKLSFNNTNTPIFIDNILSWPFAFFLWPQLFQRMFMAKSEKEVKSSSHVTLLVFAALMLCIMTMGATATAVLHGELSDPDQLVAAMYQQFFPLGGLLLVIAVIAASMSTVDSILLTLGSIVTRDLRTKQQCEKEILFAKRSTVLFLLAAIGFCLSETGRGAITPLVTLGASLATLMLWPLLGLKFDWIGRKTAIFAMLAGLGVIVCQGGAAVAFLTSATILFLVRLSLVLPLLGAIRTTSKS